MLAVNTEDLRDLSIQIFYVIAVSLLPEFSEAAEILPDLRGGQTHLTAQLAGRDALDPGGVEVVKLPEIAGHSSDDIV